MLDLDGRRPRLVLPGQGQVLGVAPSNAVQWAVKPSDENAMVGRSLVCPPQLETVRCLM
jgi:hypothetical protein